MEPKTLFENEVHLGHPTQDWNPKVRPFIHSASQGTHIFDLEKTIESLARVEKFLKALKLKGGKALFVGTKPQSAFILQQQLGAKNSGLFFVDFKWAPGLLTNFSVIRKQVDAYLQLKSQFESGEIKKYTKKEIAGFRRQLTKLEKIYRGVAEMRKKPDVVIVLDGVVNHLALTEARKARCTTIGILDSNANPDLIDLPIPANDDSIKSICFLVQNMLKWME